MEFNTLQDYNCKLVINNYNSLDQTSKLEKSLELEMGQVLQIEKGVDDKELLLGLTLTELEFKRQIYSPNEITATIILTPSSADSTYWTEKLNLSSLQEMFLRKPVELTISGSRKGSSTDTENKFTIEAKNYFIHQLIPSYKSNSKSTSVILKLKIYSLDKLMTLDKYSQAYLGRKLKKEIAKSCNRFILGFNYYYGSTLKTNDTAVSLNDALKDKESGVKTEKIQLQHLAYAHSYKVSTNKDFKFIDSDNKEYKILEQNEFIHPYLVQYNESFYDFLVRVSNRCGEFLYFEDGTLNLGLNLSPTDDIKCKIDGKEQEIRAVKAEDITSTKITGYEELEYHNLTSGVLPVSDYARDSIKDKMNSFGGKGTLNQKSVPLKEGEDFPHDTNLNNTGKSKVSLNNKEVEVFTPHYYYNSEVAHDEFFMPLYLNGFGGDGKRAITFQELFYGEGGAIFFHYITLLLNAVSLFDLVTKIAAEGVNMALQALRTFEDKNRKGKEKYIEKYASTNDPNPGDGDNPRPFNKTPDFVVPFSEGNLKRWTTLEYYSGIKRYQDEMERQMVTIKMGSNFNDIRLGEVVKLDISGDDVVYVVCENEIILSNDKCEQIIKAIPLKQQIDKDSKKVYLAYPPAIKGEIFKKSGPQTAFVVDSADPKRQGRVRIRYPWQSKMDIVPAESLNFADSDEAKVVKSYNQQKTEAASPWIRMASPSATRGGGMYFKPEKGDEVLVNFENGNVERPYVVGALYSKNTLSPADKGGRIIVSKYGHKISFKDPSDAGWQRIIGNISPMAGFIDYLADMDMPDWGGDIEGMEKLTGGIDISDAYGLYKISMSSDNRAINISSPLGEINLSAFQGIKISAPNGDIKISGKNIDIEASNRLSILSGKNLKAPNYFKANWDKSKGEIAKTFAKKIMEKSPISLDLIDLDLLRTVVEVVVRPVNGTLSLKTPGFMKLEAGKGNAEIPYNNYSIDYFKRFSKIDNAYSNDELTDIINFCRAIVNAVPIISNSFSQYFNNILVHLLESKSLNRKFLLKYIKDPHFKNINEDGFFDKLYSANKYTFVETDISDNKLALFQQQGIDVNDILNDINTAFEAAWKKFNDDGFVDKIRSQNFLTGFINAGFGNENNSRIANKVKEILTGMLTNRTGIFAEMNKLLNNNQDSRKILGLGNFPKKIWKSQKIVTKRDVITKLISGFPTIFKATNVVMGKTYNTTTDNWTEFVNDLNITIRVEKYSVNPIADFLWNIEESHSQTMEDHEIWNNGRITNGKILFSDNATKTWYTDPNNSSFDHHDNIDLVSNEQIRVVVQDLKNSLNQVK